MVSTAEEKESILTEKRQRSRRERKQISGVRPAPSALPELWPAITGGVPVPGVKTRRLEGLESSFNFAVVGSSFRDVKAPSSLRHRLQVLGVVCLLEYGLWSWCGRGSRPLISKGMKLRRRMRSLQRDEALRQGFRKSLRGGSSFNFAVVGSSFRDVKAPSSLRHRLQVLGVVCLLEYGLWSWCGRGSRPLISKGMKLRRRMRSLQRDEALRQGFRKVKKIVGFGGGLKGL
ncbi:hypothetical protein F2Q68_00014995 [Brassica cretica]|uniref:Uncharacterized protein n=1 Tax=Brassica cretica TaxID=69181 RepID=A0A8S9HZ24_BRACR|nr:hypothetical protein F2Q68_00014995 [Brassica cretica]